MATMLRGVVQRLIRDKGFGFVRGDDGIERFFHRSSVTRGPGFDTLVEGDAVQFAEELSDKGPRATSVERV